MLFVYFAVILLEVAQQRPLQINTPYRRALGPGGGYYCLLYWSDIIYHISVVYSHTWAHVS